jgi:hypothetical protein
MLDCAGQALQLLPGQYLFHLVCGLANEAFGILLDSKPHSRGKLDGGVQDAGQSFEKVLWGEPLTFFELSQALQKGFGRLLPFVQPSFQPVQVLVNQSLDGGQEIIFFGSQRLVSNP